MQRTKAACQYCNKEVSLSNLPRHEEACKVKINKKSYALTHDGLNCLFCGKECKNRNSLCNHERMCKANPDRQMSSGFAEYNKNHQAWNKGLTKETDIRVNRQAESLKQHYTGHDAPWLGRSHTAEEKQKIGAGVKAFLQEHPEMVPYLRNHSSAESYPEAYFKQLFETENIDLIYHHRIDTYELDFCDLDRKLDIEIDGEQHYVDPRIVESDKRRTEFLQAAGWTIYRIRWSTYKVMTEEQKHNIILQIKSLLA